MSTQFTERMRHLSAVEQSRLAAFYDKLVSGEIFWEGESMAEPTYTYDLVRIDLGQEPGFYRIEPEVKVGDVLFNAPRPIHGNFEWVGRGPSGQFWALVVPLGDPRADAYAQARMRAWMLKENRALDATVVQLYTEAEAEALVEAWYDQGGDGGDDQQWRARIQHYRDQYKVMGIWAMHWPTVWEDHFYRGRIELAVDQSVGAPANQGV